MKGDRSLYILLSLLGLCIAFSPAAAEIYHEKRAEQAAKRYETSISSCARDEMAAMLEAARDYNAALIGKHLKNIYIPAERDESSPYYSLLNQTGDGCMGTVEIPCIDVTLPIYHFTDSASLETGAGHLQGSSLPVGGIGTHTVLIAHRGLPGQRLFTDLDSVTVGDVFYLHVLGQTLAYEVDSTEVVPPEDAASLAIDEEKDKCTLVTCTPDAVNNMRLLVHGIRTEDADPSQAEDTSHRISLRPVSKQACFAAAGILAALLISIAVDVVKNKRQKPGHDETSR